MPLLGHVVGGGGVVFAAGPLGIWASTLAAPKASPCVYESRPGPGLAQMEFA